MKSKDVLALLALILGIVGGVLLLIDGIEAIPRFLEGRARVDVGLVVVVGVGIIAPVASAMIWRGSYFTSGVINIVLGFVAVVFGRETEGVIVLVSGVLGIIAPKVKD